MARIVGQKRAREIWYLCRFYDAKTAYDWGLVNKVVPYKAKILMVVLMVFAVILFHYAIQNLYLTAGLIIVLLLVVRYVIALPSKVPGNSY